ncbi:Mut7-C RNAse domain-containing protein [Actibacterium sp. MT2.3-13A]|uniref:DUF5615 family PIN-like protein n=1 Tax=Actibacterium sp. MT2.3-13A TaxID=2828332 RepID=UPI001BA8365C|nr:Mut7-C RNAse domain-containing protein [Actibacterium sp. MT2.3-13A]
MRFLCDAMLGRLARWLRAAGHDTRLAGDAEDDRQLLATAAAEERIVLTRDRGLAARRAGRGRVFLLHGDAIGAQARELRRDLGLDWLHDPFSRCVVDNAPLRAARPEEAAGLPPGPRETGGPVARCPVCGRLYWVGDHHRRMRRRLEGWQEGAAP